MCVCVCFGVWGGSWRVAGALCNTPREVQEKANAQWIPNDLVVQHTMKYITRLVFVFFFYFLSSRARRHLFSFLYFLSRMVIARCNAPSADNSSRIHMTLSLSLCWFPFSCYSDVRDTAKARNVCNMFKIWLKFWFSSSKGNQQLEMDQIISIIEIWLNSFSSRFIVVAKSSWRRPSFRLFLFLFHRSFMFSSKKNFVFFDTFGLKIRQNFFNDLLLLLICKKPTFCDYLSMCKPLYSSFAFRYLSLL